MSAWGEDEEGWDLFAVVRSCRASSRPLAQPPEAAEKAENSGSHRQEFSLTRSEALLPSNLTDLMAAGNYHLELENFCLPFFTMDREPKETLFPCSFSLPSPAASTPSTTRFRPQPRSTPRSKRRRNQQKRVVCHVPAEGLAADKWAWRKYGQKPIKGSPYPRGYYRCSSSKGCSARKQVERSKSDPEKFVITYTAEHNHALPTHRNSLAGSTRQKFPSRAATTGEQGSLSENSPSTTTTEVDLLRRVKKREEGSSEEEEAGEDEDAEEEEGEEEEEEEGDGLLLVEDMEVVGEDEVFFMGVDNSRQTSPAAATPAVSSFFDVEDSLLFQP